MRFWLITNALVVVGLAASTIAGASEDVAALGLVFWLIPSIIWLIEA
jgi:hypothetical protein